MGSGWDAYANALIGGIAEGQAALYGNGPVGLWYQHPGFQLTQDQVAALVDLVKNPDSRTAFAIGDKHFIRLNCEAGWLVRGKFGEYSAAAALSNKAILILVGRCLPHLVAENCEKYAADLKARSF